MSQLQNLPSFTLLKNSFLDFRNGPNIARVLGEDMCNGVPHSRCQLHNRFGNRSIKVIQTPAFHSTAEHSTHIRTDDSEPDEILLESCARLSAGMNNHEQLQRTRITVRMMLTEPKAAFAGGIFTASFARLNPSMAALKAEIKFSWSLGFLD